MAERNRVIYLCHDIEAGLGHLDSHPDFSELIKQRTAGYLEEMLSIERCLGIRSTYNVVGCLLSELKTEIIKDGHCLGFHSYDHDLKTPQLVRCRQIDSSIIGYRTPCSVITAELNDNSLRRLGFKWLASSRKSLGTWLPKRENGIVKIPILFDDFEMFSNGVDYHEWEAKALSTVAKNPVTAFCLHDCYAFLWLPYYMRFMERVNKLGTLSVLDNVEGDCVLR